MFKVHGGLATCPGFTYSPKHYCSGHLFHNSSQETVAIARDDRSDRWVKERGWLRGNHLSPPLTGIPELAGFHRDLYFCLDIALRRLKDLYSWKPSSLFLPWGPSGHAPIHSFVVRRTHIPWEFILCQGLYCLLHSLSYLLLKPLHRYSGYPHFTDEEAGIKKGELRWVQEWLAELDMGCLTQELVPLTVLEFCLLQVGKPGTSTTRSVTSTVSHSWRLA